MKKLYLFTGCLLFANIGYSQSSATFDGNQIEAIIYNKNGIFADWGSSNAGYEFPAGSNRTTIWLTNLWVYGKDSVTDVVKGFGDRYFASGQDTWPGPLTTDGTATVSPSISASFDKVWKVTQEEIDSFIINYNNGNVTSLAWPVPNDILTWPANAAPNYEQPHFPFHDHNNDGLYDAFDGDYPKIKGDQMLRWIFNDNLGIHTEALAPALGAEVQANFYGCSSPNMLDPLNRTTFLEYTIINRSDSAYKDVYIGLNVDADIGGAIDDYMRSNVSTNTMQFYNADDYDDPFGGSGHYGYGAPVQSLTILEISKPSFQFPQPLMSGFMYYNNSGGVTGDPNDYVDQYNYLRNFWKDGSHLVYGGNGYPSGPFASATQCRYMFPGDSDPTNIGTSGIPQAFDWSEEVTGTTPNSPGDRRGIMSAGPFNLSAGESISFTIALITTQDSTITIDSLLKKNIAEVNEITAGYLNNTFPCQAGISAGVDPNNPDAQVSLFPNPTSNWINIQSPLSIEKIEILNMYGSIIHTFYNTNTVNVEGVSEGMYFMRLYLEGAKNPVTRKILITK